VWQIDLVIKQFCILSYFLKQIRKYEIVKCLQLSWPFENDSKFFFPSYILLKNNTNKIIVFNELMTQLYCSQNIVSSWSLKACTCCKSFLCHQHHGVLLWEVAKECLDIKIFLMCNIYKISLIFGLCRDTVSKVN